MAARPILMPKLGLTMTEGVIAEWKVATGDRVSAGDILFVVETDKISNDIEASDAGVIGALNAQAGDIVQVGETVLTLVVPGDDETPAPPSEVRTPTTRPTDSAPARSTTVLPSAGERVVATPLARRVAAGAGVDLSSIGGSGPRGRILAGDVHAAIAARVAPAAPDAAAAAGRVGSRREFTPYQRAASRRLTEAKRDIPHFYVFSEADVTDLVRLRAELNADLTAQRLSFNHFIVAAVGRALAAMPAANVVWADDAFLDLEGCDVGIAVEAPRGLVAPVLRGVDELSLDGVADGATELVARARDGRLRQDDLEGGATAVSNVGMLGATGLLPIVNPGQSSILGVGRSQPLYRPGPDETPQLRQILSLTLSCDHRVVDGAVAARFLQAIQQTLEAPLALLRQPKPRAFR